MTPGSALVSGFVSGFVRELLRGLAQIMLQPAPLVGALFFAGFLLNSSLLSLLALLGCGVATVMARICGCDVAERQAGLYGFNGALVGLTLGYFYQASILIWVLVILGGMASTLVMREMLRRHLRPLTFPFILVSWLIMSLLWLGGWSESTVGIEVNPDQIRVLDGLLRAFGQVMFQENLVTGAVFLGAIILTNRVAGFFALLGAGLSVAVVSIASLTDLGEIFPVEAVNLGLFGYNAVLCGIVFAGWSLKNLGAALLAIVLSILFVRLFQLVALPALTFPFVLASWLVFWLQAKSGTYKPRRGKN
ncbi:urea transporter [Kiloniella laminariae]|uniref:Urea transporter n=1 Tax=Kiloniella laminariae TaxID=454162 RepID=A0ABT4LFZ6_9PROT|nr:urea transporter [Kiloniella laminariae]MCZ4280031.1 urea transporter [Kiloniella laminariae]